MTDQTAVKRAIHGIILVNKPKDDTSNAVLQKVKRIYGAAKAGHTGSLDPMATGMLPICFGEATKVCQYLLDADKCYVATARLGIKTTTADATGAVVAEVSHFDISQSALLQVLQQFTGQIEQVPSMYSALKHQGVPLYRLARQGIEIARQPRAVHIYELQCMHFDGQSFQVMVRCSKGTYIRNLIEDIGEALGVGAHVTHLHRSYTAGLAQQPMYSLETLAAFSLEEKMSKLLPMSVAVAHFPLMTLTAAQLLALRQGKRVAGADLSDDTLMSQQHERVVRLVDEQQQFVGLGVIDGESVLRVKRLLSLDSAAC